MQRHGHNDIGRLHAAIAGAQHPSGHHRREIGAVAVFQRMHENAGEVIVECDGAQPVEGWRAGDGVGAENAGAEIVREGRAEHFAIGPLDEGELGPAMGAEARLAAEKHAAAGAGRRINGIERHARKAAQPAGEGLPERDRRQCIGLTFAHAVDNSRG